MNNKSANIKRISIALLLVFVLSFGTVFATDETPAGTDNTGTQIETPAGDTGSDVTPGDTPSEPAVEPPKETPKPAPVVSHVIKKGKYYYYKDPKTGKIRKKKGFVWDAGKLYYIGKKGRITAGKTFKVKKKKYRAHNNGSVCLGVYKWNKKLNYSNPKTGVWVKKECIVTWKGNKYYIRKGGKIAVSEAFAYKNIPYKADSAGKLTAIPIPDNGNVVTNVAKKQVGVMTGKTYWKWYFHTKFKSSNATPWCGAFVAWCFNQAGVYDKVTPIKKYGNLGYVPSYSKYADKRGKWIKKKNAQGGDIVIYSGSVHVGLVEGIYDGYLITIEGNTGPTALIRGKPGAVTRKICPLNAKKIKGIIRVF